MVGALCSSPAILERHGLLKVIVKIETEDEMLVLQELHRTFPCHQCFIPQKGHADLRCVLVGYSVHDSVGYCQVLNRLTYASTLSHLRRLKSPIGREGCFNLLMSQCRSTSDMVRGTMKLRTGKTTY